MEKIVVTFFSASAEMPCFFARVFDIFTNPQEEHTKQHQWLAVQLFL